MREPTDEELREYEERLNAIIEARQYGKDTSAAEAELKQFMRQTGIAEEAPPDVMDDDGDRARSV